MNDSATIKWMLVCVLGIAAILLACSKYAGVVPLPAEEVSHGNGGVAAKPAE